MIYSKIQGLFLKNNLGGGSWPNYFSCLTLTLFRCLILGFVSLSVYKAKAVWLRKLSKHLLMCLTFHIRVAHFSGMPKRKSIYTKYPCLLSQKIFSQAHLIWATKLDVSKIGIPLPKRAQNTPCNGLLRTVSPIMVSFHFILSPTLYSS